MWVFILSFVLLIKQNLPLALAFVRTQMVPFLWWWRSSQVAKDTVGRTGSVVVIPHGGLL